MVESLAPKEYETFQTWSSNEIKPLFTFKGHTNSVESVAFNQKSLELVSGSHDHSIKRWDLNAMKCVDTFINHKEGVNFDF
jgi:WD40 repeat protein